VQEDDGWGDWGEEEDELDGDKVARDGNTNLNKLSTKEIEKRKKAMEANFKKNQIAPGQPGFQYDKRIDIEALKA